MKGLLFVVLMGICSLAFADMEGTRVQMRFSDAILNVKASADGYVNALTTMRDRAQDLVTAHPDQLESADKAKLPTLKTNVNAAITELNAVVDYINAQWPDLE